MDHSNDIPFARLPLQTALVIRHDTNQSLTHLNERIVTRGHIFTRTEHAPGHHYGILRSPTTPPPPNDAAPPALNGVPPLLIVHTTNAHAPNSEPWRDLGWRAIIFLQSHPNARKALPAEAIDVLTLSEEHFWLIPGEHNMHEPKSEARNQQWAALERALRLLVHKDFRAALDVFRHADGFHSINRISPALLTAIRVLQRHFPHDTQIARTLLAEYGSTAHEHASGAAAIRQLERSRSKADQLLLGVYDYAPRASQKTLYDAARRDPTTFLIPVTRELVEQGDFKKAITIAQTVWSTHNDRRIRVVAARIARDAARFAGDFERAHRFGEAALKEATVGHPADWREFKTDLNRITEIAAYMSNEIGELLNTFPYNDKGDLAAIARESLEFHTLTRDTESAVAVAQKRRKTPRSILRLHYLYLAEQAAQGTGRFTRAFRAKLQRTPPSVRKWFELSSEREKRERFLRPQRKNLGTSITALHVGARLYSIGDRHNVRLHTAAAARHLRGTRRLAAQLSGAFDPKTMDVYDTWFTGQTKLYLTLLGEVTARLDDHVLELGNDEYELLILLALNPQGISQTEVVEHLFEGETSPALVRARVTAVREHIDIGQDPYRLSVPVVTDYHDFIEAQTLNDYEAMLRAYTGPVFPQSRAPFFMHLRKEMHTALQEAVAQIHNITVLIERQADFVDEPWYQEHLETLLAPDDPRWSMIRATEQRVSGDPS